MSTNELLDLVIGKVPYPHQIQNIDITLQEEVRFDWRGTRFKVVENGCEQVGDGVLIGSDIAILMRAVLFGYIPFR